MWIKTTSLSFVFALLLSTSAFALVTEWEYTLWSVFSDSTFQGSKHTTSDTQLTWGGANFSSLTINHDLGSTTVAGTVNTYTGIGDIADYWNDSISMTHDNKVISAGNSLLSTALKTTVVLKPLNPLAEPLPPQDFYFDISFKETPNVGAYQEDVFALVSNFPNFNFTYLDGLEYFVNVFPAAEVLFQLVEPYASFAGVPTGTIGFITPENMATTLPFAFTISTKPLGVVVPEPSTFLLLGAGLLSLGFYVRRRQ